MTKKKKFTNKSLEISPIRQYVGETRNKCIFCKKYKSDVKYRKLYDYINCEDDMVMCCSDCEGKFWEDL